MLTGKIYDILKWIALLVLPASATAFLLSALVLEWDAGIMVAIAIVMLSTFLGLILQISGGKFKTYQKTDQAFDGYVQPRDVDPDTGIPGMMFTVSRHPVDFLDREFVRLKVGAPPINPVYREPLPDAKGNLALDKSDGPPVARLAS